MDLAARGAGREEEARQTLLCSASLLRRTPPLRPQIRHGRGHRGGGGRQGRRGQRHGKVGEGPALEVLGGCPRRVGHGEGGGAEHAASLAILGGAPAAGGGKRTGSRCAQYRRPSPSPPWSAPTLEHAAAERARAGGERGAARTPSSPALLPRQTPSPLPLLSGRLGRSARRRTRRCARPSRPAPRRAARRTTPRRAARRPGGARARAALAPRARRARTS